MIIIITFLYVLLALLVFGVLIFVHEAGHFMAARICGVGVKEFAIGMGPKLLSWNSKKYDTQYSLRLFPIGGYVSMIGEDEDSDDEGAFCNKSIFKRISIVLAGPLMNVLVGFILMVVLVVSQGSLVGTTIAKFSEGATSSEVLCEGDKIVKVGNTGVHTFQDVAYEIMHKGTEPIDITVIRNGERITLRDVTFPTFEEQGMTFGDYDFIPYYDEPTVANYAKHAYFRSVSTVKMICDSFVDLISGRYGFEAISGPVGVTEVMVDAAKANFHTFLYVVIIISINLGVFNLIPFPALDGGRLILLVVEGITRKPIKREIEGYINFIGLMILLVFMAVVVVKDVFGLFGGI